MIVVHEKYETAPERWCRLRSKYLRGINYCDMYIGKQAKLDEDMKSKSWERMVIIDGDPFEEYGYPTQQLRQELKEKLKDEFLRFWETI